MSEQAALKVISVPRDPGEIDYLRSEGFDDDSISQQLYSQINYIVSEYKVMVSLRNCPHIVHCNDYKVEQHTDSIGWNILIKMELLTPLMKVLESVSTEEQIIHLGCDLCQALVTCQQHNILHRDIKPQNIFLDADGHFKLGDFGISRTVMQTTHATAGIGTYNYMPPEVFSGKPYGHTADIYSLGMVLYWLLNEKRHPFLPLPPQSYSQAQSEQARIRRLNGDAIPEPAHGSQVLKRIVLKACSFHPKDRYASALEMLGALLSINEETIIDTPPKLHTKWLFPTMCAFAAASLFFVSGFISKNDIQSAPDSAPAVYSERETKSALPEVTIAAVPAEIFATEDSRPSAPSTPATESVSSAKKSLIEYEKNDLGQVTKTVYRALDGSISGWYVSEYNEAGKEIYRELFDVNGASIATREFTADGFCHSAFYSESPWTQSVYDSSGNLCEQAAFSGGGNITDVFLYTYKFSPNTGKHIVHQTHHEIKNPETSESDYHYECDDYGNIIKEYHSFFTIEYTYDSDGNRIKETTTDDSGTILTWTDIDVSKDFHAEIRTRYMRDGTVESRKEVIYGEDGREYLTITYDRNGTVLNKVLTFYYPNPTGFIGDSHILSK